MTVPGRLAFTVQRIQQAGKLDPSKNL